MKLEVFIYKMILFLAVATSNTIQASTLAVEADASAYLLKGDSFILRYTFENGIIVALGAGKYELPEFILKVDQKNFEQMKWKAKSKSIQVARVGYRFSKAYSDGVVLEAIAINQSWHVTSQALNSSTNFKTLSLGISTGYFYHIGKQFYLYPIVSLTSNSVTSGSTELQGNNFNVKDAAVSYSLHTGFEF